MNKVYLSPSVQEKNIGVDDYGTEEYRANQICDVVEKELIRHGVKIKRNTPDMNLSKICADSNSYDPDLHFAIHTNAYDGKTQGTEVFCHKKNNSLGHVLANNVYSFVAPLTPANDRGVKQGYNNYGTGKHMYELYHTSAPAALVEIDFHDNVESAKWILNHIYEIGVAITKGILKTLKITYIPEVETDYLYRVVCGSFSNKDNAIIRMNKLKESGYSSFIEIIEKS